MNNLSADQLRRAASIKDEIESLEGELSKILGGVVGSGKKRMGRPPKTGGDVDRYKAARGTESGGKKKRKMSAAGRAKIAAAAKARWAKVKAAGKNSL
jgi:hypothetical protein